MLPFSVRLVPGGFLASGRVSEGFLPHVFPLAETAETLREGFFLWEGFWVGSNFSPMKYKKMINHLCIFRAVQGHQVRLIFPSRPHQHLPTKAHPKELLRRESRGGARAEAERNQYPDRGSAGTINFVRNIGAKRGLQAHGNGGSGRVFGWVQTSAR